MSNNKQSSVEQFAIALYENGLLQGNGNKIDDLLLHFKAMHKEETMDAYDEGCYNSSDFPKTTDAEQYYNETYGNTNGN